MPPKDKVLLVEGRDDREVIFQFCNHHGIDNRSLFDVKDKDGVDSLIDDLSVRVRTGRNVKVLAAVIDADDDINVRWAQVRNAVGDYGYSFPDTPAKEGTILNSSDTARPRLGIWLMPDNQVSGMLEDFLLRLTSEEDPLILRAENVVKSIPESERLFGETKRSKAIIHSWLAWQEDPGTSLGIAITRRYLDPTRNPAPEFKKWLEDLFHED